MLALTKEANESRWHVLAEKKRGHRFLGNPLAFSVVELEGIEPTPS
jgi:hypothetical protein